MRARVSTLCVLQGIIEHRRSKIREGARIVFSAREEGGSNPVGLGWYEFIGKANTWPGSYMNSQSKKGTDNPGG